MVLYPISISLYTTLGAKPEKAASNRAGAGQTSGSQRCFAFPQSLGDIPQSYFAVRQSLRDIPQSYFAGKMRSRL
jgi:hypothetical protein